MVDTRNIIAALIAIALIAPLACQKKVATAPASVEVPGAPEEPVQKLAWEAAHRVSQGLRDISAADESIHIENIFSGSGVPEGAASYFKESLENHLKRSAVQLDPQAALILNGNLFRKEDQLVFTFIIQKEQKPFFSDSVNVPFDERLENTLAQFESKHPPGHMHQEHHEMPVPSPLVELAEAPLDLGALCSDGAGCSLVLLFADRIVQRNWQTGEERKIGLENIHTRSRAPSGKIILLSDEIVILNNNLRSPLQFNKQLEPNSKQLSAALPEVDPGRNDFTLADGSFYDFELLPARGIAVIDTDYYLNIAEGGNLVKSTDRVGGTLSVAFPAIYTSSHSLPGRQDAILKFGYENGALKQLGNRTVDGDILDLAITDLNQDGKQELLVTLRNARGIFVEVFDP